MQIIFPYTQSNDYQCEKVYFFYFIWIIEITTGYRSMMNLPLLQIEIPLMHKLASGIRREK